MIHKIKALYDNGHGLSQRAISRELKISRPTVRKYLEMDESKIAQQQQNRQRTKSLDAYRDYLKLQLGRYPELSAVKLMRRLQAKCADLQVSDRTLRRYIQQLKKTISLAQIRHYTPVVDQVPGVQCQVDPGELREVMIGGKPTPVYFVVFVLSCSRKLYVGTSARPIDTERFIQLHDEAFRYFGGCTEECVYDQTKLVVISEIYRELELNSRFYEYATHAGFRIHACEGYDPESKGKVEAGVKYVKQNAFYGETFQSWEQMEQYLAHWLDEIANQRVHGTTGKIPEQAYEADEKSAMKPYLTPTCVHLPRTGWDSRKVDKTGLISWKGNSYSVPMKYQQCRVGVEERKTHLFLYDLESQKEIASHRLSEGKGQRVINRDHYRDKQVSIEQHEQRLREQLGDTLVTALCQGLKRSQPRIYKDQLVGVQQILKQQALSSQKRQCLERLADHPKLRATLIRDHLQALDQSPDSEGETRMPVDPLQQELTAYRHIPLANQEQEVTNHVH